MIIGITQCTILDYCLTLHSWSDVYCLCILWGVKHANWMKPDGTHTSPHPVFAINWKMWDWTKHGGTWNKNSILDRTFQIENMTDLSHIAIGIHFFIRKYNIWLGWKLARKLFICTYLIFPRYAHFIRIFRGGFSGDLEWPLIRDLAMFSPPDIWSLELHSVIFWPPVGNWRCLAVHSCACVF